VHARANGQFHFRKDKRRETAHNGTWKNLNRAAKKESSKKQRQAMEAFIALTERKRTFDAARS